MNTSTVKILALLVAFASGAFAHNFYFKPSKDMVKLENKDITVEEFNKLFES